MPPVPQPTLSDGILTLRPKLPRDAAALTAACQDPQIARWTFVPSPYTRAHAEQHLASVAESAAAGRAVHLHAVDAEDRLLGSFSVMGLDREPDYGELGYWMAAPARGRGIATRATLLLRDWSHRTLGLRRIEILPHVDNVASRRVAEKAGFRDTGETRPAPRGQQRGEARYAVYVWSP